MNFGQEMLFKNIQGGGCVSLTDHTLLSLDSNIVDARGLTALSLAIVKDNVDAFNVIMRLPHEKVNDLLHKADNQGRFPVELAAKSSTTHFLERILSHDPDLINQQNSKTGCVIMHMLLRNEHIGIGGESQKNAIRLARRYHPDMSVKNNKGETPEQAVMRLTGVSVNPDKAM